MLNLFQHLMRNVAQNDILLSMRDAETSSA